jgi:hypothetical protein
MLQGRACRAFGDVSEEWNGVRERRRYKGGVDAHGNAGEREG